MEAKIFKNDEYEKNRIKIKIYWQNLFVLPARIHSNSTTKTQGAIKFIGVKGAKELMDYTATNIK